MVKWKCFAFLPACSEGGCRCVWLFVPSQETLQGWRACSACSRTLAHWTSITCFPLFLSQLFIPSIDFPAWRFFIYPVSLLFLLFSTSTTSTFPVSHKQGQAHTHNTHRLISFKDLFQELRLCGLERIQMLPCLFVFFFPPNTPTGCCIVDVKWFWCFLFNWCQRNLSYTCSLW